MINRALQFIVCAAVAAVSYAGGGDVEMPSGEIVGGLVADDGDAFVVGRGQDVADGSFVIHKAARTSRGRVLDLPNTWVKRLTPVSNSKRLLLFSRKGPSLDGHGTLSLEIVKLGAGNEVRRFWTWNSRDFAPDCKNECPIPVVSGDGKVWGVHSISDAAVSFVFGSTKSRKNQRAETVSFPTGDTNLWPMQPSFEFLASDGPVVLMPWSGGAYIVHFRDGASPFLVPVLQGPERLSFRWQGGDRLLWVRSGRYWRAFHLWDYGLSGFPAEPSWEVERKGAWEPHSERGMTRIGERDGEYRIEHAWREPWTRIEERHVSQWQQGSPPRAGGKDFLVSGNGRHALVLESRRTEEGESVTSGRRLGLDLAPQLPPVEAAPVEAEGQKEARANPEE